MDARNPLFGAVLRADRARMPIRSIKRHLQRWADLHWEYITLEVDENGFVQPDQDGHIDFKQTRELPLEILGKTSVWIGEAVYNMRSALDYLVYALANTGRPGSEIKGTQFPIEDSMNMFASRITGVHPKTGKSQARYLEGVPTFATTRIMQVQPCWDPPCEWTALIRELSNPDKHRYLSELRSHALVVSGFHPDLGQIPPDDRVHPHLIVEVRFRNSGREVVGTLTTLQREVRALIKEFEPAIQIRRP